MPLKRPILGNELPDPDVDSDKIWSEMGKPTGKRRPSFWYLFVTIALMFFVSLIVAIVLSWMN